VCPSAILCDIGRRIVYQPYIRALERFKAFATQKRKKSCLTVKQEKLGFYHIKDVSSSFIWSEHQEKWWSYSI